MTTRPRAVITFWAVYTLVLAAGSRAWTAEAGNVDYAQPELLTGTVYETASGTNKILYQFTRTAARSNLTVRVTREFSYPNGSLAAREEMVYERGRLASFHLEEKQTGAHGSMKVGHDPENPTKKMLLFDWTANADESGTRKTDDEAFQSDSLVADMIPEFIRAHWNELARGQAVNFRYVAQSRLETVGFKLVKESEVTARGLPALRIRMQASSFIIAQIVDPLFFVVEKADPHRILEYEGRTTPKRREGSKWKDLDARTVYDWK